MIQTMTRNDFHIQFKQLSADNFTEDGLDALFNYLEGLERKEKRTIEFNVRDLCREFSEFEALEQFHGEYADENRVYTLESLQMVTTLIMIDAHRFIIREFNQ